MSDRVEHVDVVVVGAGNAAFSAAHAARERVSRVLVLEKAPREWLGGNSYFTAGAFRTTYSGLSDLRPLLDDLGDEQADRVVLAPYTPKNFADDMRRVTYGRCDPLLTQVLVEEAAPTLRWLHAKGLRWRLMFDRQSYEVDGVSHFWGGLTVGTVGGGQGLIEQHLEAARRTGIEVRTASPVTGLLTENGAVAGVRYTTDGVECQVRAGAVVIAAGGFEADPLMRAQYLGPRWDVAKLRGTPYNSGEVLRMALDLGAQAYGHWSGSHAIAWDAAAPDHGDLELTNRLSRQGYPLGIVVNTDCERFVDEGADFRNYTYARYGAAILEQPGGLAFQLFDAKTRPLLSTVDYDAPGTSCARADTIEDLAEALGLDPRRLRATVDQFNGAVQPGEVNPATRDGIGTVGVKPPKSNWAQPLDSPPYYGFPVTCGVSFTFGGVRVDERARVLDRVGRPIPGLSAAGELVGGLFYHNYPGGSGLMAGAVFGYRAGVAAAQRAGDEQPGGALDTNAVS
jgi:tricarballylate dehydrogenase